MFDNLLTRCNVTRMVTYVTQWHTCACLRQRHWGYGREWPGTLGGYWNLPRRHATVTIRPAYTQPKRIAEVSS